MHRIQGSSEEPRMWTSVSPYLCSVAPGLRVEQAVSQTLDACPHTDWQSQGGRCGPLAAILVSTVNPLGNAPKPQLG